MQKSIWIIIVVVLVLLAGGVYFITQGSYKATANNQEANYAQDTNPLSRSNTNSEGRTHNIEISGYKFNPITLTIKTGDTIIWTNMDSVSHTVTSDSGTELTSPLFSKGQTYSHTFNTVGTFNYHCIPHPNMKAKIIVE